MNQENHKIIGFIIRNEINDVLKLYGASRGTHLNLHGEYNGYIAVHKSNLLSNKRYGKRLRVHKNVTLFDKVYNLETLYQAVFLQGELCDIDEDYVVIGFDVNHVGDNPDDQNREYSENEVRHMIKAAELCSSHENLINTVKDVIPEYTSEIYVYQEEGEDEYDYDNKVSYKTDEIFDDIVNYISYTYYIDFCIIPDMIGFKHISDIKNIIKSHIIDNVE